MKCPICDTKMEHYEDWLDGRYILLEEANTCRNCQRYSYEFVTGNYRVIVGSHEITWNYMSLPKYTSYLSKLEDWYVFWERINYKIWRLFHGNN